MSEPDWNALSIVIVLVLGFTPVGAMLVLSVYLLVRDRIAALFGRA